MTEKWDKGAMTKEQIKEILLLNVEAEKYYDKKCKEDEYFALSLLTDPNDHERTIDMASFG